jgi:hypothetical protein
MTWPISKQEYGTYRWLCREVGGYLGYGFDSATWDHDKISTVESIVQSGVMQFYFPPPVNATGGKDHNGNDKMSPPHQWSFLNPAATISLADGRGDYELPADFGQVIGAFTGGEQTISIIPEVQLRQMRVGGATGKPLVAAVRPKRSDGNSIQKWEVLFHPIPDAASELSYRYSVSPLPLSDENQYPLGGRQYAETILQSCLAVADSRFSKETTGTGINRFMDRLAASVQLDMQSLEPTEDAAWPSDNLATDLSVNKAYLKRVIGIAYGYGPNSAVWSHKQAQEVNLALETGLRKFYNPPLVGSRFGHQWSFLFPTVQLNTAADRYTYDLPEDFAMLHGPLTYAPGRNTLYPELRVVGEHQVRRRLQAESLRSRPTIAAVRPKPPEASGATRYELLLWPIPDGDYPITYRYRFNPNTLTDEAVLPHGGPPHAQTVVEACLAAVEELQGKLGVHSQLFMASLASSIALDQKASSPDGLGYNRDRSDAISRSSGDWRDYVESPPVTYNGNLYD